VSIFDTIKSLRSKISRLKKGPTTEDLVKRMVFSIAKKRNFPNFEQWKHFPRSLSKYEKQIVLSAFLVFSFSFIFLGGRYIFTHQALVPAHGGEYSEALIGSPQFVNPLYAGRSDVDRDLTHLVFSGLVAFNGEAIVPDLAESYDISDDGKTYTFVLKKDLHWHDGKSVTANDVINTFAMIQNPEYLSPLLPAFKNVTITLADDRTIQFALEEPSATFLSRLTVGILPSHIWDLIPPRNAILAEYNLRPIGSGPYRFEKFNKDNFGNIRSYTLVRNSDYKPESANIERLIFRFYPDVYSAIDALVKKNVEGVSFIPAEEIKKIKDDKDIHLWQPTIPQYSAVFFNEIHAPVLKDVFVRKALSMAIDKNRLVTEILGQTGAHTIETPILPGMPGYNVTIIGQVFDIDSARTLLETAGKTIPENETSRFSLTLTTINSPEFVAVAEFIKESWGLIGVNTELQIVDVESLQTDVLKQRAYDVLLSGALLSGGDPDPYAFWHSSQTDFPGLNISLYSNRKADTLIEEGQTAVDTTSRAETYRKFQELLLEDLPAIFLYQPTYTYALSSALNGVQIKAILNPDDRFANITSWYIKTKYVLR